MGFICGACGVVCRALLGGSSCFVSWVGLDTFLGGVGRGAGWGDWLVR